MTNPIIQFFQEGTSCPDLPEVVDPFRELAIKMDELLEEGPNKAVVLYKLLEACDAAVRLRRIDLDNQLFKNTPREENINGGLDRARAVAEERSGGSGSEDRGSH